MAYDDIDTEVDSLAYRSDTTDAIIMKRLWISKNVGFMTIFKLDRMAHSVSRTRKS